MYLYPYFSFIYLCHIIFATNDNHLPKTPDENKIRLDGDVIFGGLFPMHEKGQHSESCGKLKKERGVQRLEAMLFAVDQINKDTSLLPGIKIGVHILDTCSADTYALEQCMDFIKAQLTTIDLAEYQCENGKLPQYIPLKPVAGVIGAASSPVSIMVANILRLFKIPQISYSSTSIDLSDKTRFEYFSRVVPPDSFQAQAMVDIALEFGWSYVSTLADEGNYGEKGIGAFEEIAKKAGLCVAQSLKIPRAPDEDTFTETVNTLLKVSKAKAVVMFVNEDNCRAILRALVQLNRTTELLFLASDSWGAKIHPVYDQEFAAEGAVTLLPKRRVVKDFDEYFLRLNTTNNIRNPWFKEYIEVLFNCTLSGKSSTNECTGNEHLGMDTVSYEQEGLVQFVIDSVYALAHALDNLLIDRCPGGITNCSVINKLSGPDVLRYVRNVSFQGISGDYVRFNNKGDSQGKYNIFQYEKMDDGSYTYVRVGEWTDKLLLNRSHLRWRYSHKAPKSVCSEPCDIGYARKGEGCCWVCIKCNEMQYLKDNYTCEDCPSGYRPDSNKTVCIPLPVLHLDWNTIWVILPLTFSLFGIACCVFVLAVFIKYNKTPVIMASGRELCYALLIGIAMSYGTSIIMLTQPTLILCTIKRLGLGISLCLIYAAMLTKTNRIYRIFSSGIRAMVKRPGYTSPRSQIFICMCLVSVQVVGGLTWLGFEKPDTIYVLQQNKFLVLKCRTSQIAIMVSLLYNIFLIVLCTVYAFKTRKIPQNFNEAQYIAFTMYSTCIVWLAFIPIYFGANHDFKIEITSLCMGVSISATVALVCLFVPKIYIVLFQPHKNVRHGASLSTSSAYNKNPRAYLSAQLNFSAFTRPNGNVCNSQNDSAEQPQQPITDKLSDSMDELSCDEASAMKPEMTSDDV